MITVPRPLSHLCPLAGTAFALAVLLTGCGKTEVQSYRVPKENAAALPGSMTTTAPAAPAAAVPAAAADAAAPVAGADAPPLTLEDEEEASAPAGASTASPRVITAE